MLESNPVANNYYWLRKKIQMPAQYRLMSKWLDQFLQIPISSCDEGRLASGHLSRQGECFPFTSIFINLQKGAYFRVFDSITLSPKALGAYLNAANSQELSGKTLSMGMIIIVRMTLRRT